ncbi:MAG: hypothetical protein KDD99_13465 [Bacteroidetes bacterium]|nr:hypothetical protein [Bacteroidota bacterium]
MAFSNQFPPPDPKTFMTNMNILSGGFIVFLVGFAGVVYFTVTGDGNKGLAPELDSVFSMIVPLFALSAALGGYFLYGLMLKKVKEDSNLPDKLSILQKATVLRFAFWDGGAIMGIIGYLMTGSETYFLYSIGLIALFVYTFPTRRRVVSDLNLSSFEERQLVGDGGRLSS